MKRRKKERNGAKNEAIIFFMSSIIKKIADIQDALDALKVYTCSPKKIDDCTNKKQLKLFTIKELTHWLKKHNVHVKKIQKKHKKDFINIIWNNIETDLSDSETDSLDSETDSSDSD